MPFLPWPGSVAAVMIRWPATGALVIHIFEPLITHSSPSSRAVLRVAPASEPACGSVRPKAAIYLPSAAGFRNLRFCSLVPNSQIGALPRPICAA